MTNDLLIVYDGVDSTSATEAASANSVRIAYEKGVEALNKANDAMNAINNFEVPSVIVEDSGWLVPELNDGIKAYSGNYPVKYRKRDGIVEMRGAIAGVAAKQTAIFTLPEGWRPNSRSYKVCATDSGLSYTLELNTDGVVKVLTDASGYAATNYYFIDCVFIPD